MHGYIQTRVPNPMPRQSHTRVIQRVHSSIDALKRLPKSNKHNAALKYLEQEFSGLLNMGEL